MIDFPPSPHPGSSPEEIEAFYAAVRSVNHGLQLLDVHFGIDEEHPEHGLKLYLCQKRTQFAIAPDVIAFPIAEIEPLFKHYLHIKLQGEAELREQMQTKASQAARREGVSDRPPLEFGRGPRKPAS